ncbi:MAG: hypothetical protein GY778_23830 [bacterium]|nr:hypothetical protein [bacterium]
MESVSSFRCRRRGAGRQTLAVIGLAVTGCMGSGVTARADRPGQTASMALPAPTEVDPAVPTPPSVIGHGVGERAVRYPALVRYLRALADSSPLVTLTPYAASHEGRTLHYLTITSPANHARLEAIRAENARLADPRTLDSPDQAEGIIENLPGIAWMAYAIHGDELSSTDAAVQLAYQLAAGTDAETRRLRDELVIHIDPLMNPDGRERYLAQLQTLTGKTSNPDHQAMQHRGLWSAGRGNHYLFDLNRDWLVQTQPETRGRAAEMLKWNPHLVVDSHEMGELDTYLFDPPREPFNAHLSQENMAWRRRFSADQARAFDRHGWSYYTGEWYEEWYPGYTNAWANLLGSVGLLYEQAAANSASVTQRTGLVRTYSEAVHHQLVSSLANLETLRANRAEIISAYHADRRWAVSNGEPFTGTFLLPPPAQGRDRSTYNRFLEVLHRQGVEVFEATESLEAHNLRDTWGDWSDRREFEAGTLVVRSSQPHRRLLHAMLNFDPHMSDAFLHRERTELENRRSSRLYDVTASNLAMTFGLEAYWAERAAVGACVPAKPRTRPDPPVQTDKAPYGYLIDGADADIHRALTRLFDAECKPRLAIRRFKIDDREYKPGTLLLRRQENPDDLPAILGRIIDDLNVEIRSVSGALSQDGPDLGGNRFRLLHRPRVAIAAQGPVATTSFGSIWYLLDVRTGLRTSPVNILGLGSLDLRKYNVLVLPRVRSTDQLGGVLDKKVLTKIKAWVASGGTLVAAGGSAAFLAHKDRGLSAVRLRRDMLDQLPVYAEALKRERDARTVEIDPAEIWAPPLDEPIDDEQTGDEEPNDDPNGKAPMAKGKADLDKLKRADEWSRVFSPRGAIVGASVDPEHWLGFGVDAALPVQISGSYAYLARHPVSVPVRLVEAENLRLSGLLWPEARERWADSAYVTVERLGHGQVILFAGDPFFRAYQEGTGRLLLNAVLLGPGAGASPPVPW